MINKKISVIMGIFNCADTLPEAINSILAQTYTNWELIMCDDGSVDDTYKIAKEYCDKFPEKIILIKNQVNSGLNYTLNKCLELTTGDLIARMDGDDISMPERFEKQVKCLSLHPEMAIVSSEMEFFDENGVWGTTNVNPRPEPKYFLKSTPFCHAACLVKKQAFLDVDGYTVDKKLLRVEDYHLWVKMYQKGYRGMNIKETLYKMRDDRAAQKRKKFKYRFNEAYVKAYAVKTLKLPIYGYFYCLKPIILGFIPSGIYKLLHRRKRLK